MSHEDLPLPPSLAVLALAFSILLATGARAENPIGTENPTSNIHGNIFDHYANLAADCKAADEALEKALTMFEWEANPPANDAQAAAIKRERFAFRAALTARLKLNCSP